MAPYHGSTVTSHDPTLSPLALDICLRQGVGWRGGGERRRPSAAAEGPPARGLPKQRECSPCLPKQTRRLNFDARPLLHYRYMSLYLTTIAGIPCHIHPGSLRLPSQ